MPNLNFFSYFFSSIQEIDYDEEDNVETLIDKLDKVYTEDEIRINFHSANGIGKDLFKLISKIKSMKNSFTFFVHEKANGFGLVLALVANKLYLHQNVKLSAFDVNTVIDINRVILDKFFYDSLLDEDHEEHLLQIAKCPKSFWENRIMNLSANKSSFFEIIIDEISRNKSILFTQDELTFTLVDFIPFA